MAAVLPIETERLRLRRLEAKDAARLIAYRADPAVARYQSWETMTATEAEELIRANPRLLANIDEWCQVAIADKTTDELIGDIGLCRRQPGDVVEIGFTVAPAARGKGLALEACRGAIDMVFSLADVAAVIAIVDSRNTSAIALVVRLGMRVTHTESTEFKGAPCTDFHFKLTRRA